MPIDDGKTTGTSWSLWETWKTYREPWEKTWYLTLAFLIGRQYVRWNSATKRLEDAIRDDIRIAGNTIGQNKVRLVSNHILRLFRQKLSGFVQLKPILKIEPATQDETDIKAAQIGNWVAKYLQRKHEIQTLQRQLWTVMMAFGRGSIYPYFDKTKGQGGEEDLCLLSPFDTFWPRSQWPKPPQQVMCLQAEHVDDIKARYGVTVAAETDLTTSSVEQQLRYLLEQKDSTLEEDQARVLKHFALPSAKYPQGRYRAEAHEGVVLYDGPLPQECFDDDGTALLPIIPFDFYEVPLSEYPQSFIEPLISPQREYNYKISRITNQIKLMGGKVYVPFGAGLKEPVNDETGQVIYYDPSAGQAPSFQSPPGIPASYFTDLSRCKLDMEDLAASHDISNARVPAGVRSGRAIAALQEGDSDQMMPILASAEERWGRVFTLLLRIVQQHYQTARTLDVVGEGQRYRIQDFTGSQLAGRKTITVSLGSAMSQSRVARQESVLELVKAQLLTPQEAREQLQLVGETELPDNVQLMAAKQAVESMLKGVMVEVHDFDDHALHLKVINDTRVDPDFQANAPEEVKMLFEIAADLHMRVLAQEMMAKQAAAQPPAPVAAPGGPGG